MSVVPLKAPFPCFGGKALAAPVVWPRLGDVANFIEPFCRSAAMLLARPTAPRVETLNDLDCYIANFWRAVRYVPEIVAAYADWPVNEIDLHARHRWLVLSSTGLEFRQRMRDDPDYYDAKIAGWWVWGACCWIGAGWCSDNPAVATPTANGRPQLNGKGQGVNRTLSERVPDISGNRGAAGRGIHASAGHLKRPAIGDHPTMPGVHGVGQKRPNLSHRSIRDIGTGVVRQQLPESRPQLGDQHSIGRGVHANDKAGTCAERRAWLMDWMNRLSDRLRVARVCCGDWLRVCNSPSVTTRLGMTGVFLDAPYRKRLADGSSNRDGDLYGTDRTQDVDALVDRVIKYCLERGSDPQMRIAACCLEGEGYEVLAEQGWECVRWRPNGGYGNRRRGNRSRDRERIYFSPSCLKPEHHVREQELF